MFTILLLCAAIARAADTISISNVPNTVRAGETDVVAATVNYPAGDRSVETGSIELMFGEASAAGNDVADIISINDPFVDEAYTFPRSLVAGPYHIRFNATTNSTTPPAAVQQITTRSPTVQVTSADFTCAGPSQFPNVTSPNATSFTSFRFITPQGGDVEPITSDGKNVGSLVISWTFRDQGNVSPSFANGIDKLSMEVVRKTDSGFKSVAPVPAQTTDSSFLFNFAGTGVIAGVYQLRTNYTNVFQDGAVKPGQTVSALSEPFFIASTSAKSQCVGVPGKGSTVNSSATITKAPLWLALVLACTAGLW